MPSLLKPYSTPQQSIKLLKAKAARIYSLQGYNGRNIFQKTLDSEIINELFQKIPNEAWISSGRLQKGWRPTIAWGIQFPEAKRLILLSPRRFNIVMMYKSRKDTKHKTCRTLFFGLRSGIQNIKHKLIEDLRASYRGASFPKKSPAIHSSIVMCPSQAQCGQTIRCFSSLLQWLDNSFKYCREDSIHLVVSSLFLSILDQLKFTFNNMKTKPVQQQMHYNQLAVKLMLKISLTSCPE